MSKEIDPLEELEMFLDNVPTVRCGEGGCDSCDAAYRCSVGLNDVGVRYDHDTTPDSSAPAWDSGDTYPAIPELLWDELGGEG